MQLKQAFSRALLGSLLVLSASISGCAENNSTLYIDHAVPRSSNESCDLEFKADSPIKWSGRYDPDLGAGYMLFLQLGNQLTPLGDSDTLKTETSRIALRGAEVLLMGPDGNPVLEEYSTPQNGTVNPANGRNPGIGGAGVMVIPAGMALADGEYQVRVRVFGETLGNTPVESGYFYFPITVAAGVLNNCNGVSIGEDDCLAGQDNGFYCGSP